MPAETDAPAPKPRRPPIAVRPDWESLSDDELLELRFCELGLRIEGSSLEPRIAELYAELAARGIAFRPHFWLADDWFTPDGVPGVAIPFYLAHPRLAKLELNQLFEIEGGTPEWCMKILRHESGHAMDNAYKLQRRRRRLKLFGRSSTDTRSTTHPSPTARASSSISTPGTRRAIPTRTSPRRSRCG